MLGSHERIGLREGEKVEIRASDEKVIGYYKGFARKMCVFPFPLFSCNFLLLNTNTVLGRMKNIKIRSQQMNNMRGFGRFGTICTIQKT